MTRPDPVVYIDADTAKAAITAAGFTEYGEDDIPTGRTLIHTRAGGGGIAIGADWDVASALAFVDNAIVGADGVACIAWVDGAFSHDLAVIAPDIPGGRPRQINFDVQVRRAWWCGWYMPAELAPTFELHSPYWESGLAPDGDGNFTVRTMVAAVLAESADGARERIRAAYDEPPDTIEWRWDPDPYPIGRPPFTDRFPAADWMAWDPDTGVTCRCTLSTCDGRGDR